MGDNASLWYRVRAEYTGCRVQASQSVRSTPLGSRPRHRPGGGTTRDQEGRDGVSAQGMPREAQSGPSSSRGQRALPHAQMK